MLDYIHKNALLTKEEILNKLPDNVKQMRTIFLENLPFPLVNVYCMIEDDLVNFILRLQDEECEKFFKLGVAFGLDVKNTKDNNLNFLTSKIGKSDIEKKKMNKRKKGL